METNSAGLAKFQFDRSSERVAQFTVDRSVSPFGLRSRTPYEYELGPSPKPLFKITLPDTPVDDKLEVAPVPGGHLVPDRPADLGDATVPYRLWSMGSCATRGETLLSSLPAGQYCLVRTARRPSYTDEITMGNLIVDSPPNVLTLLESEVFYSYVFGSSASQPPKLDAPLIGIPVLNYIGTGNVHGVIFLACVADATEAPAANSGDVVLVVPVSGSLMLNVKVFYPQEQHQRDSRAWRDSLVSEFVNSLLTT